MWKIAGWSILNKKNEVVAQVFPCEFDDNHHDDQQNINLIAAAPEMYRILEKAYLSSSDDPVWDVGEEAWEDEATRLLDWIDTNGKNRN